MQFGERKRTGRGLQEAPSFALLCVESRRLEKKNSTSNATKFHLKIASPCAAVCLQFHRIEALTRVREVLRAHRNQDLFLYRRKEDQIPVADRMYFGRRPTPTSLRQAPTPAYARLRACGRNLQLVR